MKWKWVRPENRSRWKIQMAIRSNYSSQLAGQRRKGNAADLAPPHAPRRLCPRFFESRRGSKKAMEIIPFQSIGTLSFGDSRKVARAKLASTFSTFQKGDGPTETDAFDDLGLHLYYDEEGRLEFVEAFDPAE